MKKKNGFTLIEVSVSIALLAVMLLFIIKFITMIRRDEDSISYATKLELTKSLLSKNINEDIKNAGGIKSVECEAKKCSFVLNNDEQRELLISEDYYSVYYNDVTHNKKLYSRTAPVKEASSQSEEEKTSYSFTQTTERYYYFLRDDSTERVFIITIVVKDHPDYNIEIVSLK